MCSGGGIKLRIEIDSMTMRCGSMMRMRGWINGYAMRLTRRLVQRQEDIIAVQCLAEVVI